MSLIHYSMPVKRQFQLKPAEAYAIGVMTRAQAVQFMQLGYRTMSEQEIHALLDAVGAATKEEKAVKNTNVKAFNKAGAKK